MSLAVNVQRRVEPIAIFNLYFFSPLFGCWIDFCRINCLIIFFFCFRYSNARHT